MVPTEFGGAAPLTCSARLAPSSLAGGTMPVASSLQKMLGAPALLLPMGQVCSHGLLAACVAAHNLPH